MGPAPAFYNLPVEGQADSLLEERVNRFANDLAADLRNRPGTPPEALKLALVQIVSVVMLPTLVPGLLARQPAQSGRPAGL